ncbi:MAG: tRNA pseudouridine(38-40) synthase TruA [Planctomycetaceae bacterium]|nr:tRNA pseudouridine(38-40) synthase TruA [Planctomycetaceae bacterium]
MREATTYTSRVVRVTIEYDGSAYNGWQVQNNAPSVQAAMESAVNRLTGTVGRVRGAGRTDAGVHARGQVAVLSLPEALPVERVPEALNSRLPDDIAVVAARECDAAFDPRRDCVMKQYSYSLTHGRVRPALGNRRSWHVKRPLDIDAMVEAAGLLAGHHDYTSFANRERAGEDNVRSVDRSELVVLPDDAFGRGRLVYYVEGRSFLYNQVRAMTGTLFGIGTGRFGRDDIPRIFAARDRAAAGESAPPWGLCLEWVLYPGEPRPIDRGGLACG